MGQGFTVPPWPAIASPGWGDARRRTGPHAGLDEAGRSAWMRAYRRRTNVVSGARHIPVDHVVVSLGAMAIPGVLGYLGCLPESGPRRVGEDWLGGGDHPAAALRRPGVFDRQGRHHARASVLRPVP